MIEQHSAEYEEAFRDHLATHSAQGKRRWVFPIRPKGSYYRARSIVSFFLLAFLFTAPFIRIGGHPLLMFNILERRFFLFGVPFWPQDFTVLGLTLITFIVFIILFTAVFGRLFCGWICPQTVFMEMVFRKIEYWVEGDAPNQVKLNRSSMSGEKFLKKTLKHSIFFILSFAIGNTFLAYIIGTDQLLTIVTEPVSQHWIGLMTLVIFSLGFYSIFAGFREQVCTLVCPYGRLQGVLLDPNSIVVHYDFLRGEPRGKSKIRGESALGDCVDCSQCVRVCPTGIDIRNGTQLECINCTACIDVCNGIMKKIHKPHGLIRYASYYGINTGMHKMFTPRAIGYSAVLSVLLILVMGIYSSRMPVEISILRTPGVMYQETSEGGFSNLYNVKVVNKTFESQQIEIKLIDPEGGKILWISPLVIPENDIGESAIFIELPREVLQSGKTQVQLGVYLQGTQIQKIRTTFSGPINP